MFIDIGILNNTSFSDLSEFVVSFLNLAISLSVVIVVASIIISGFKYILSMGNEDKVKEATRSMAYSLLGLILVFISPAIIEFIIQNILVTQ
ncbi:MAG: hypothetical protein WCY00_02795 [Candidatus Dojkabacteria bacterium]|jgi:hypothetical protein